MCWFTLAAVVLVLTVASWMLNTQVLHISDRLILDQTPLCLLSKLQAISSTLKTVKASPGTKEPVTAEEIFEYLHWTNSTSCQFAVDFGFWVYNGYGLSAPDGHKAVCLDNTVAPVYNNCLVYSFGINNQWSFDEDMARYGCNVYSFDPSMKVESHRRSKHIQFFNVGLSGKDEIRPVLQWKMERASSIYQKLSRQHGAVPIDVLKMDIEHSEWEVIPDMLRSGFLADRVKQLAVEVHFNHTESLKHFQSRIHVLRQLEDTTSSFPHLGRFVRFSSRPNPWLKRPIDILGGQEDYFGFEMAWYNSRYYNRNASFVANPNLL